MGVKGWAWGFGYLSVHWSSNQSNYWYIDTINYPNNKWQVGNYNKTVFTNGFGMVTDTLNSLPAKDTSVFILKFPRSQWHWEFYFSLYYSMDGDTTDFGMIEISPDSGNHWVNILTEDTLYQMVYPPWNPKPTLKGSITWGQIEVRMDSWEEAQTGFPVLWTHDTALIRFTYITDSGSAPHDGWLINQIEIADWHEGINDISNNSIISIAPNPVEDMLHIKRKIGGAKNESIQVVNMMGEVVKNCQLSVVGGELSVDVSGLEKGVYLLRYSCDKGEAFLNFEL